MRNRKPTREPEFEVPFGAITCPFCTREVPVEQLSLVETLWMHEYECNGIAPLIAA